MKYPIAVVTKKSLILSACMIALAFALMFLVSSQGAEAVYLGYAYKKVPIYKVDTQEKKVALTFDAAWGADKTKQIVDTVKSKGANATFFLVSFWVDKYPEMVKYIDDNGLEIGTHSATHPKMSQLSKEQMQTELSSSAKKIEDITGKKVTIFRPPFGDYNNALIETADALSLKTIQWSIDSLDWKDLGAQNLYDRVVGKAAAGDIILCHNNSTYILEALPRIIDELQSKGYQLVTVSELIYHDGYEIDAAGTQKKVS